MAIRTIHTGDMGHEAICAAIREHRYLPEADPRKGRSLIVVKGKHVGATGVCVWRGANQFGTYHAGGYNKAGSVHNQRVGIRVSAEDKPLYVPLEYVRVIGFENDPSAHPSVIHTHISVANTLGAHGIALPGVSEVRA